MPYRPLGRTGERVSAIGLGGYHIGKQPEEQESIRLIRSAIDEGITFMDNCWDYNGGASEIRMGKALRDGYRENVFLMSKIRWPDKGFCRLTDRRIPATLANRSRRSHAIS
jgi:aryl-alcohol dehydrogenase-like predicted oxidoreductase